MLLLILLILNVIIVAFMLLIAGSLDNASKFQIPDYVHINTQTELADDDPWDYYTSLRHKSWDELSEYEKERIVVAAHLILDDCGTISTLSELKEFLQIHLPEVPKPYPGGDGLLDGFRELQKERKVQLNTYLTKSQRKRYDKESHLLVSYSSIADRL